MSTTFQLNGLVELWKNSITPQIKVLEKREKLIKRVQQKLTKCSRFVMEELSTTCNNLTKSTTE